LFDPTTHTEIYRSGPKYKAHTVIRKRKPNTEGMRVWSKHRDLEGTREARRESDTLLVHLAQEGDKRAEAALVTRHYPLVLFLAKALINLGVQYPDLVQVGCLGLMEAIRRSAPEGSGFPHYAGIWIKNKMVAEIRENGRTVRRPKSFFTTMASAKKKFAKNLPLTEKEEISLGLGRPEDEQRDYKHGDDWEPTSLMKTLACPNPLPDTVLTPRDNKVSLEVYLLTLTPRERVVVEKYYGLLGAPRQTCEEIAEGLGVTKARVSKVRIEALKKMQKIHEGLGL
jgi:RNA polymerase nonessential primary-like sigma factor